MNKKIIIGNKMISKYTPTFIVAEMSANHNMDFERAKAIIKGVKDAGGMQLNFKHIQQIQLL